MSILALNEGTINVDTLYDLSVIDISFYNNGSLASVSSLLDLFYLDKSSSLDVDGITVIATSGTGRWIRTLTYNLKWAKQNTWYVDGLNGNDENNGNTSGSSIKTLKEWSRRVGHNSIENEMIVYILEDTAVSASDMFYANINITQSGKLIITGELSNIAPVYFGNINSVTDCNPANNQPWVMDLNDPFIPNDFWNSHASTSSNLSERLRTISNLNPDRDGYVAWVAKDLFTSEALNKACRVSQPIRSNYNDSFSQSFGNFEAGDVFIIERLPRVCGTFSVNIACLDQSPRFILKDISTSVDCGLIIYTNNSPEKSCVFYDCDLYNSNFIGNYSFVNCKFNQLEIDSKSSLVEIYAGLSLSPVNLYSDKINIDFRFMIQGGSLNRYSSGSNLMLGSIQIYDSTESAINFYHNSSGTFLDLHNQMEIFGNNNTMAGVRVFDSAAPKYKDGVSGFTLIGNIADLIIGTNQSEASNYYSYSDLPVINLDTNIVQGVKFVNSISGLTEY